MCEDGTAAYGDVLVGADGIWSSIRKVCLCARRLIVCTWGFFDMCLEMSVLIN